MPQIFRSRAGKQQPSGRRTARFLAARCQRPKNFLKKFEKKLAFRKKMWYSYQADFHVSFT